MDQNLLSSLLFSSDKNIEFIQQLNIALKQLIENDTSYVNNNGSSPKIWECKWLNSTANENGYPQGYAVWMNTNTYDQITSYYYRTIQSYVANNATLNAIYQKIDQNDGAATNQFFLDAARGTASPNVSAIYCLGDISQPVQIRISKKNNNKEPPTTSAWEDFFEYSSWDDNYQMMMNSAISSMTSALTQHTQHYHLSGITNFDLQKMGYFKKYPFNVNDVQQQYFFDHEYCTDMQGFDYVRKWKMSPDGSVWCKIWNSGYVEQGGFVDNLAGETFIPVKFMTTYNYPLGSSFYQRDYKTYNGQYDVNTTVQASNRYIVTVTPMLVGNASTPYPSKPIDIGGELIYSSVDVTNMTNSGFSIVNTDLQVERYKKYSWHVCGYKVITDETQMFDNPSIKIASDLTCFTIQDNVVIGFDDDGYMTVVVPNGVISIGKNVFNGCYEVQSFILPKSLSSIGDRAFFNCTSINGIVLPDNVTHISSEAFSSCSNLAYVSMGQNVDFVGTSAFCNDAKLATITRFNDEDSGHTFNMVGDYAFYGIAAKKLNLALKSAAIDSFWGDYCFAGNDNLQEVNILSSSYMSTGMFSNCHSLETVNFKNNHTSYVYPKTFENCTSLKNITLPSKIWYISEEMFKGCTSLKSVKFNIYDKLSSMINLIQRNAFYGCSSLQELELPETIDSLDCLDDACLSNCALSTITFHGISKASFLKGGGSEGFADVIEKTGMFRLCRDCKIICAGNEQLNYAYNSSLVEEYTEPVNYTHLVDKTTTSNFDVANVAASQGKFWWYYNSEPLFAQANSEKTPCLFIYSLLGCKPCQTYAKNIFNNPSFQDWAKKQKFYLCGIECEKQPYYDTSLAFCSNVIRKTAENVLNQQDEQNPLDVIPNALGDTFTIYQNGNSNLMTPVLVFYYNNGTRTTSFAYSYHEIDKYIRLWGVDGVIQCLKSLCLYHFDNNDLNNARFVVDAERAFDISDYDSSVVVPEKVVVPMNADDTPLMTVQDVNNDIIQRLKNEGYDNNVVDNVPYLGGCEIIDIPYLVEAFGDKTYDLEYDIKKANEMISADFPDTRFKIGNEYYTFSFSETDTRMIISPCYDGEVLMGSPVWTKAD